MFDGLMPFGDQWTIFVGGALRVPPRGRTHRCAPTYTLFLFERKSLSARYSGKLGPTAPGNGKFPRLRLLMDIVHGLKGFGKADFVLTKTGGRDKQNTWEAG